MKPIKMEPGDGTNGSPGEGQGNSVSDPLSLSPGEGPAGTISAVPTVYVTIPQNVTTMPVGNKGVHSVIQQAQPSVIQSTQLQTVQIPKGNVILLKHPSNSVIQAAGAANIQTIQVIDSDGATDSSDVCRKRQILSRRPSYRKILNDLEGGEVGEKSDLSGGDSQSDNSGSTTVTIGGQQYHTTSLLKVIPASSIPLSAQNTDGGIQTIAMTNAAASGGAIVHYAQGSDGQLILPVAASDISGLKITTSGAGGITQGIVLAAAPNHPVHSGQDQLQEEANRKRELRLMKNREAARECRAKKKEYIKCLENRVAVLENQNKALIEELKTLKSLYCQST